MNALSLSVDESSGLSVDVGDDSVISPVRTRGRFNSMDSYVGQSADGSESPIQTSLINSNNLRSPETIVGSLEWQEKQRELVKGSYSERERKLLEDYSGKKMEEKDADHVYHLPPIEPPTPSLSKAKKILQKGDTLLDNVKGLDGVTEEEEHEFAQLEHEHRRRHESKKATPDNSSTLSASDVLQKSENNHRDERHDPQESPVARSNTC